MKVAENVTFDGYIDPENKYFRQRFYRENCISVKNKVFIKDLRIFVNRKLENLIGEILILANIDSFSK